MKEKFLKVWTYLVVALFGLGLAIMYGVARSSKFNIYIFAFGGLLIVPGIISIMVKTKRFRPKANRKNLMDLKFSGMRIPVDLKRSTPEAIDAGDLLRGCPGNLISFLGRYLYFGDSS